VPSGTASALQLFHCVARPPRYCVCTASTFVIGVAHSQSSVIVEGQGTAAKTTNCAKYRYVRCGYYSGFVLVLQLPYLHAMYAYRTLRRCLTRRCLYQILKIQMNLSHSHIRESLREVTIVPALPHVPASPTPRPSQSYLLSDTSAAR
jgi:hypothetical protein